MHFLINSVKYLIHSHGKRTGGHGEDMIQLRKIVKAVETLVKGIIILGRNIT